MPLANERGLQRIRLETSGVAAVLSSLAADGKCDESRRINYRSGNRYNLSAA